MAGTVRRGSTRVAALALVLALAATACGGSTPPPAGTTTPSAGPAATEGAATATASGSGALAGWLPDPAPPEAFVAWEDALIDRFAASSGLVPALGDGGWAFVKDQIRTTLSDTLARNGVAVGPGLVASTSAGLSPTAAGGAAALGIIGATIMVSQALANPTGPLSNLDANLDHTSERTVDGVRTVSHMSGRIATSIANGRVTGTVGYGIDIETFDPATGQSLGRMSFALSGTVDLGLCPDADGKVEGTVSMELSGGTPSTGSARLAIEADVVGVVNDAAVLSAVEATGATTDATTSASGAQRTSSASGHMRGPVHADGTLDPGALDGALTVDAQSGEPLTQAEADERYARIGTAVVIAISMLAREAQEQWRGGACVEIQSSETGRDVRPNERVPFEAKPFHRIEQRDLAKPVDVTFAGEASVDPVDIAVQPPVHLLYIASSQKDHTGTVSLKSTSNRGIGTLDVTFRTVIKGWMVDHPSGGGRIEGRHCGDPPGDWVVDGTYDIGGMRGRQQWTISIDASGTAGTYTYTQVSSGRPGGSPVTVTVRGRASGTVTLTIEAATGRALMHLKEQRHTYQARAGGGWGQAAPVPLEESDLAWEPDPTCPSS